MGEAAKKRKKRMTLYSFALMAIVACLLVVFPSATNPGEMIPKTLSSILIFIGGALLRDILDVMRGKSRARKQPFWIRFRQMLPMLTQIAVLTISVSVMLDYTVRFYSSDVNSLCVVVGMFGGAVFAAFVPYLRKAMEGEIKGSYKIRYLWCAIFSMLASIILYSYIVDMGLMIVAVGLQKLLLALLGGALTIGIFFFLAEFGKIFGFLAAKLDLDAGKDDRKRTKKVPSSSSTTQ